MKNLLKKISNYISNLGKSKEKKELDEWVNEMNDLAKLHGRYSNKKDDKSIKATIIFLDPIPVKKNKPKLKDKKDNSGNDMIKTVSMESAMFALRTDNNTDLKKQNEQRKRFYLKINGIYFPEAWDKLSEETKKERLDALDSIGLEKENKDAGATKDFWSSGKLSKPDPTLSDSAYLKKISKESDERMGYSESTKEKEQTGTFTSQISGFNRKRGRRS